MQTITTIGFDIAKSVFQVHGDGRQQKRHERSFHKAHYANPIPI